jgi:hypothetical protein
MSINFGGFSTEYYAVSTEDQRRGGLMEESSSESSQDEEEPEVDEGDVKQMEDDNPCLANGGEEEEDAGIQFPPPAPLIEHNADGTQFRFIADRIPSTVSSITPQIMKALASYKEATAKQKAAIAWQPCMPLPVHASPLVSLFENKYVLAKGQQTAAIQHRPYKEKYMPFMRSCYQLHQLIWAFNSGLIPFHPSFTEKHLRLARIEYQHQQKRLEYLQNQRLDDLYQKATGGGAGGGGAIVGMRDIMREFVSLLESYSLQYIHLMEYFIYTCLIEPHAGALHGLPLEACLTPNVFPVLSECGTRTQQQEIIQEVVEFFKHKVTRREEQERQNAASGVQNTDAAPLCQLHYGTIEAIVQANGIPPNGGQPVELYGGYMPFSTLYEYFCFMDIDGVLTAAAKQTQ